MVQLATDKRVHFCPPVIAHRGASAYAPENTMAAFVKAAQLGAKWIEFDVMQTACGQPIIFHDETLDRITKIKGSVQQFPYAYLATLDVGVWFDPMFSSERIPTFSAVLDFLYESGLSANVEIKAQPGAENVLVERVLAAVKKRFSLSSGRILFSSFSVETLQLLRKNAPEALLGLLLHEWEPDWEKWSELLACVSVHVNHDILTAQAARKIKRMGKQLLCYTVNDPARAQELFTWGVDAIFTDVPDRMLTVSAGCKK